MTIAPIIVGAVPGYRGLDDDSADNYYRASQRMAFLSSEIIGPFETGLKESTEYGDDNIPKDEVIVDRDIGQCGFKMKVTPTTKRPGYKDVFYDVQDYLQVKLSQYNASERPVGVFTIDGEPYISAFDVLDRIRESKERVMSKGVKIEITERPDFPDVDSMVLPLGMDFSELIEGNAGRYLEAFVMSARYGKFISEFENELIGPTGFSNDNPPDTTEHMYRQIGSHIFHVKSVPFESISYGNVVKGLDGKPGKRNVEMGGDLVLVTNDIEIPRTEVLKPKKRDGDKVVRLNALLERICTLVEDNTQTKVRQKPLNHYPIV